jgi:hypothetical protein
MLQTHMPGAIIRGALFGYNAAILYPDQGTILQLQICLTVVDAVLLPLGIGMEPSENPPKRGS